LNARSRMLTRSGSSPRSRGTPVTELQRKAAHRFIPAIAGNTIVDKQCSPVLPVHPRDRGEHRRITMKILQLIGSSPRSRGTRPRRPSVHFGSRFIPAIAGNTSTSMRIRCRWPVHPRDRGEHVRSPVPRRGRRGSSPRSRGTPPKEPRLPSRRRFIPAIAGNTRGGASAWRPVPVHPRDRGEHTRALTEL